MEQTVLSLDMFQSAGVGAFALLLGYFLTRRIPFLKRFCIPAPVSGGLIFSLLSLALYGLAGVECSFDGTIKDFCMMVFFTTVGFQSDMKMLRRGGKPLLIMILLVAVLITCQNLLSVGIARGMGLDPLFGMAAGSIPMCGGHGTAGGFAPLLEQLGLAGAPSLTLAAATFGLVAGSLIGGPLAEELIRKRKLTPSADADGKGDAPGQDSGSAPSAEMHDYVKAVCLIIITMGLGVLLSKLLSRTGIVFPTYFGSLIAAALIRNLMDLSPRASTLVHRRSLAAIGDICLSLFLGIAMATLKLWELAGLALPLCLILLSQAVFIALYARFIAFPALGRDYDAALLTSGLCGFGLGATPNAMANMTAVCYKYSFSVKPFIIVPIIGAMFVDLINTGIITLFLNFIRS